MLEQKRKARVNTHTWVDMVAMTAPCVKGGSVERGRGGRLVLGEEMEEPLIRAPHRRSIYRPLAELPWPGHTPAAR